MGFFSATHLGSKMEHASLSSMTNNGETTRRQESKIFMGSNLGDQSDQVHESITIISNLRGLFRCGSSHRSRTRLYQIWPGKNVFFIGGRVICGPDPRGFLLTSVSIILSNWVFCTNVGVNLSHHSALVLAFSLSLTAIVFVNLILSGTRDPGIIPRNDSPSEVGTTVGSRSKKAIINGVEMKLKYCRVCKIFRPPRSCHCIVCDNCVEKFDHHCPWIGQCIGLRNYRYYMMFIFSALVFFIYVCAFSWWEIRRKISAAHSRVIGVVADEPETFAVALFSFFAIWFLGGLAVFHIYLISMNQTARENFKQQFAKSRNPYDKGILYNIKDALFTRLPPSKVSFRSVVVPVCDPTVRTLLTTLAVDEGYTVVGQHGCRQTKESPEKGDVDRISEVELGT